MLKLVSFASGDFVHAQKVLASSALKHGVSIVSNWTRDDMIGTDFYRAHQTLLDSKRGAGYWIWKPYIILQELAALREGDVLIYSDTGRPEAPYRIDSPLGILADWCIDHAQGMLPGTYIPEYGPNDRWTKGECFRVMDCESHLYRSHPQIQATFSVWQRHSKAMAFVSEWLQWCTVPAAIADERVYPEIPDGADFVEHRHDQSILTLLALRHGLKCYGRPDQSTPFSKNMSSLVDRIARRNWSMRRRFAAYDLSAPNRVPMGRGLLGKARQAKRYIFSFVRAIKDYP